MSDRPRTAGSNDIRSAITGTFATNASLVQAFHDLFYNAGTTWQTASWRGVPTLKAPTDLFVMQEIIWQLRPDLIIETGTAFGGTALFFADLLEMAQIPNGRVYSVELNRNIVSPVHPRLTCLKGSSISPEILRIMRANAAASKRVIVDLDSAHEAEHVYEELRAYAPLVTPGSWLIVEDTNFWHGGPGEAVHRFMGENNDQFFVEPSCERYLLTFNPGGYLRRVGEPDAS